MLNKVEGIVLRQIKYSDSSRIITVYTREKGKRAYFINASGKKGNGRNIVVAQPLAMVEVLVSESRNEKGMGRISEIRLSHPAPNIRNNMAKTGIVLFLNEVINKCIKEEEQNEELFDFIQNSLVALDQLTENEQNFHLYFLVKLTRFLGFHPQNISDANDCYFDLAEGAFMKVHPAHQHVMKPETAIILHRIIGRRYDESITMSRKERSSILESLIEYYGLHIPEFGRLKSHLILAQVMA